MKYSDIQIELKEKYGIDRSVKSIARIKAVDVDDAYNKFCSLKAHRYDFFNDPEYLKKLSDASSNQSSYRMTSRFNPDNMYDRWIKYNIDLLKEHGFKYDKSAEMKRIMNNDLIKEKISKSVRKFIDNHPDKVLEYESKAKRSLNKPETKAKICAINKEIQNRPEVRQKHSISMSNALKAGFVNKHNKYQVGKIQCDSKPEVQFVLWHMIRKIPIERGPVFEYEYDNQTWRFHCDFTVHYKWGDLNVELKGKHFVDADGRWICPFKRNDYKDGKFESKHQCALRNHVAIIYDSSFYETTIPSDLFLIDLPWPEDNKSQWKAHRKNQKSPYDAWFDLELRTRAILNRFNYGNYGRKEKYNYDNGKFFPKHNMISPHEVVRAFTIAKIATKVSTFKKSICRDIYSRFPIKSVVDPFAGWGTRALVAKEMNIEYTGYDINEYEEHNELNIIHCDITKIIDTKHYDLLFTCPPYDDIEIYGKETEFHTCKEWIEICKKNFPNCGNYVFITDDIGDEYIDNRSHLNMNKEYIYYAKN